MIINDRYIVMCTADPRYSEINFRVYEGQITEDTRIGAGGFDASPCATKAELTSSIRVAARAVIDAYERRREQAQWVAELNAERTIIMAAEP